MDENTASLFVEKLVADLAAGNIVFPTCFDTTIKLRETLRSDDMSMNDVAAIVLKDPLLAAKTLQAANSAALNRSATPVTDVRSAVIRIGVANVRTMAMAIAMKQFLAYRETVRFAHLSKALIEHSRRVAAAAFIIAREHTSLSPDIALFAGLVHDLGLFYLLYRLAPRNDIELDDAELRQLLEDWHESLSQAVLKALDTPPEILAAVSHHDWPREVETLVELDDLLFICNLLMARAGNGHDHFGMQDASPAGEEMVRDYAQYQATLQANAEEFESISDLI